MVSVIIPVYNREEMVRLAIESVLAQDYRDLECIVYDDGSTDSSFDVAGSVDDSRVRVFSGDNLGVSAARNRAIAKASGDYIALLDSDDVWLPEKLGIQLDYMRSNGFDICQTDETWMRQGKKVKKGKRNRKVEGWLFRQSLETCLISPSCTVFSRSFWERCGPFDERMPAYEDYDLWIRGCRHYPVGLVREDLTVRNGGRPDQLTSRVRYPDLYRMYAILKLLRESELSMEQREAALEELERKLGFYTGGCRKRGREQHAEQVASLVSEIVENPEICPETLLPDAGDGIE